MGRTRLRLPLDNSAIDRELYRDSETLRQTEQWVRRKLYGLSDQQARWLYEQYKQAYGQMIQHLNIAYDDAGNPRPNQRAALLTQMEQDMLGLYAQVSKGLDDAFVDAYQQGLYGRAWALDQTTKAGVNIRTPMLPREAIRAMLLQPYGGTPWHEDLGYNHAEYVNRIKRSLTVSLMTGEGMAGAQRRLRDELGVQTDRRKGFRRNFARTLQISRTELMRSSNLGAVAVYEANQDILDGWEWVSARDGRTCGRCGAMDGKRFKFDDPQLVPPSASHPGCRCTAVPVLKDTDLMDKVAGVRETYGDWAAKNGVVYDGGLGYQTGKSAPVAPVAVSVQKLDQAQAENRASLDLARGMSPAVLERGAATGRLADYMYNFFAYDDQANPVFSAAKVDEQRLNVLFDVYKLGRGNVNLRTIEDVRMQAAGVLAADEFLGKSVLSRAERNKFATLASADDDEVLKGIDRIRDQRLKGALASAEEAARNRGTKYDNFMSAAAEDGARRLRENSMPAWAAR